MRLSRVSFVFFIISILCSTFGERPEVVCRDPDVGGTRLNSERQFVVVGSDNSGGAGIGNLLIFFPAAFYFAAVTGRDIIITDGSVLGGICSIIHCGFPFVSQLQEAFPDIVNSDTLNSAVTMKHGDFIKYFEGSFKVDSPVVKTGGFMSKSDWWVWFNSTVHCVQKITGCDLGDVMCAERHAYQRLIRGPFKAAFTAKEEERIHGVPKHLKHALLTLPHVYAPRLDAALHLRAQFHHFESQTDANHPEYKKEVSDWLNSSECQSVFSHFEDRVSSIIKAKLDDVHNSPGSKKIKDTKAYIYIASDNEQVKDALEAYLHEKVQARNASYNNETVHFMKVDAKSIAHVKDYNRFKAMTQDEGLLDLVFDWYALSLANTVLAWRKGGTNMLSTFVHSAQKVSGTIERTDNGNGRGIGTRGYQLVRDKRGNLRFDVFWGYTFLEDFQIK